MQRKNSGEIIFFRTTIVNHIYLRVGIMSNLSKSLIVFVASLLLLSCGCFSQPSGVTSSTIPLTANDKYTVIQRGVKGKDWTICLLLPFWPVSAYGALQSVKKENGCDGLINVSSNTEFCPLPGIGYMEINIRGDAIKLENNKNKVE